MVDFSTLKKKPSKHLDEPPGFEDVRGNLDAPEIAPAAAEREEPRAVVTLPAKPVREVDGRSLRKTDRTVQFATRVHPAFDRKLRAIAKRDGKQFNELLELALEAYEREKGG